MTQKNKGFTLVELMITLAMSGIIIAAVYSVYSMQQRAYGRQNQVMEVQQKLRAVLYMMGQEIRMAGFNPQGAKDFGITRAEATAISFSMDSDSSKTVDPGEEVTYTLKGDILERGNEALADYIENIEFYYTMKNGSQTLAPTDKKDIRAITISVLGRAENSDSKFTDTNTYTSASGEDWTPKGNNKHYRRQLFITTIQCRNMGL